MPSPPGTPPSRPSRQRWLVAGAIAVLVAVTAVAVALANRPHKQAAAAHTTTPSGVATTSASSPDFPSSTAQTSIPPNSQQPTPSPTLPSVPSLPSTSAHINLSPVAGNTHLAAVATLLDTYFSGINAHDPVLATSVFATDGTVNPSDPAQVAKFGRDTRTTHDDRIAVLSITGAAVPGGQGLLVHVTFRSTQAPSLGPGGQSCTNWSLNYRLRAAGSGYQLLGAQDVTYAACGAPSGLALFAGDWSGHTRSLTISASGLAVEHIVDGCCDPQIDLTVQLSNVVGTQANATADATVVAVHLYPGFPASQPKPYVGQHGAFTLRDGILTDTIDGVFYCDATQGAKGTCGA